MTGKNSFKNEKLMHEMLSIGKKDKTLTGLNIFQYQHEFDMNKSIWKF